MLRVTGEDADVDPLLQPCLDRLRDASDRGGDEQPMAHWVQLLARDGTLPDRAARRLCQRDILREDEERVMLLFTRTVYPEVDPAPEAALKARLEWAIFGDADAVDPRTALLVALAPPTHLLRVYFDDGALKDRADRIAWLTHDNVIGDATHQAVLAVQAAQMAAMTAATTAATTAVIVN